MHPENMNVKSTKHPFKSIALFRLLSSGKFWLVIVYFSFIPIFGYIYTLFPGEFYHANVAREPGVRNDEKRIGKQLEQEIIKTFKEQHKRDHVIVGNWSIDGNSFSVISLEASSDKVEFKLDLSFTGISQERRQITIAPTVSFPVWDWSENVVAEDLKDENKVLHVRVVKVDIPPVPYFPSDKEWKTSFGKALFPTQREEANHVSQQSAMQSDSSSQDILLPISRPLDREIRYLAKGMQGDPSNLDNHFQRMLYLSAVTVTTLGYGDIAPLTTRARLLISAEAIAGIIVIGLFLNTLSAERKKARLDIS